MKVAFPYSVANFWQMISAKSTEKFGHWRKNSAAPFIFSERLFYKHSCLKLVAKKVEFTHGLTANNRCFYVKNTYSKKKIGHFSAIFFKYLQKILPLFLPAADIFIGPLLCFAAELSASWQQCSHSRIKKPCPQS
jgi:hypothetical protein